jgi:acyl-ACP thioesterase
VFEMVGPPAVGRTFTGRRRVRLGDCSPGGRLRLDAAARYVQDLSDDDTRDAGLAQMTWVVRRTVMDISKFLAYLDPVEMVTWCSGLGSRWAERRVDIVGAGGGSVKSATLWVHLDAASLRPVPMRAEFESIFVPSTLGRTVSSRLTLGPVPADGDLDLVPWPLRFSDFDVMDHVNNAVALVIVEEVLANHRDLRAPMRVDVEYRSSIDRGTALRVGGVASRDRYEGWVVDDEGSACIAFRIERLDAP